MTNILQKSYKCKYNKKLRFLMNKNSDCTTNGIRILVDPEYIPGELVSPSGKYLFSYRVRIINESDEIVQLLSRHWVIINSEGQVEEVKGDGVVGRQPQLKPKDEFKYTSYCPLDTPWGTMEGTFQMVKADGSNFDAKIERFYLISPEAAK